MFLMSNAVNYRTIVWRHRPHRQLIKNDKKNFDWLTRSNRKSNINNDKTAR